MAAKSPRRLKLEASLADDPTDAFLRYGLALQCLRDGDTEEGRRRLRELIDDQPEEIPAYHQLGQSFVESGESDDARAVLRRGIQVAETRGDRHAAAEMTGLLDLLG